MLRARRALPSSRKLKFDFSQGDLESSLETPSEAMARLASLRRNRVSESDESSVEVVNAVFGGWEDSAAGDHQLEQCLTARERSCEKSIAGRNQSLAVDVGVSSESPRPNTLDAGDDETLNAITEDKISNVDDRLTEEITHSEFKNCDQELDSSGKLEPKDSQIGAGVSWDELSLNDANALLDELLRSIRDMRYRETLQTVLSSIAGKSFETYTANADLVRQINAVVRALDLGFNLRKSGEPVRIRCVNPPRSKRGSFQARSADRKQVALYVGDTFPDLEIR